MTLRERLRNPFVQQYLLEILLPLIGYFFFDWTLVIIAAFYVIDQVASEISFLRKLKAISKSENRSALNLLLISVMLFLLLLSLEFTFLRGYFVKPIDAGFDGPVAELTTFAKEELWLLFPLVLFMYYVKDQFTFFAPRRFLKKESTSFFRWHWIENAIILVLVFAGTICAQQLYVHDAVIIAVFLVLKLSFDFTIAKWADKKSNKT